MLRRTDGTLQFGLILLWGLLLIPRFAWAEEKPSLSAAALKELDANVLGEEDSSKRERMLADDARGRLREANRRETDAWRGIHSRKRMGSLSGPADRGPCENPWGKPRRCPNRYPSKSRGRSQATGTKSKSSSSRAGPVCG